MKKILLIILALFVIGFGIWKLFTNKVINYAKDSYFCNDITDVTIGEIIDDLFTDVEWNFTTKQGVPRVICEGKNKFGKKIKIVFLIVNQTAIPSTVILDSESYNVQNEPAIFEQMGHLLYEMWLKEK